MQTPVDSIALLIPFHEANMLYFCFAVRGSLGSTVAVGAVAAAPSSVLGILLEPALAANFPSLHPMIFTEFSLTTLEWCHTF